MLTNFEHTLVGVSLVAIGAVGLYVNRLLYQKLSKKSGSKVNSLLLHLILNNIGIILVAFPFPTISSFKHKWAFSDSICTFYGSSSLLFGYNIMISVAMLCLDMTLQKKFANYDSFRSTARNFMIGYSWLNSILWSLAPVIGWSSISYEPSKTSCTVDFAMPNTAYITYILTVFIFCFVIPVMVMVLCHFITGSEVSTKETQTNDKKVFTLMVLFVIEWTPFAVCFLWPILDDPKNMPLRLTVVAPLIAKLSVIATPWMFLEQESAVEEKKKINELILNTIINSISMFNYLN